LVVEWPLLIVLAMGMMGLIYRYGPDRSKPKWKWASPGVIVATILWLFGSILFTVYIYYFDSYNKTYGCPLYELSSNHLPSNALDRTGRLQTCLC
jgi:membrane protein